MKTDYNLNKEITTGEEAKELLLEGIEELAEAVLVTLGPMGNTVIISDEYGRPYITKDGVSVSNAIRFRDPIKNIGATLLKEVAQKTAEEAGDGPQPLYSKVLTPKGFVTIGSLSIGDKICGTNKSIQTILGIYPKGIKKVYKLKFANGREVECSDNHLWNVVTNYGASKTITVSELIKSKISSTNKDGSSHYKYYIPKTTVDFNLKTNNFILDPFLVGLLLGDGSLCKTGSIELALALDQEYILKDIILPKGIKYTVSKDFKKHYLRIKFSRINNSGPTMHDYVEQIGLLNYKSNDKFIPKNYLYSNYEARTKLLRGLTETDGHINKRGLLEYSTISKQLCNDVIELMRGLGKDVNHYLMKRKENSSFSNTSIYRITELKGYKYGTKLIDIEETNIMTEMMCIKVSNKDALYITDNYILTHNTTTAICLALSFIRMGLECLSSEANINDVKEAIDNIVKDSVIHLEKNSKKLHKKDIFKVALISSNNDKELANIIQKAYNHSNIVKVEEGKQVLTTIETITGMSLPVSYFSNMFINNAKKQTVEFEKAVVLVLDKKLDDLSPYNTILTHCGNNNLPLVVFTEFISDSALRLMETNVNNKFLEAVVVKVPGFGQYRKDNIADIASYTGATVISNTNSSQLGIGVLGKTKNFEVGRTTTVLGRHDSIDVRQKIKDIEASLKVAKISDYDKEFLVDRIVNLTGTLSIIKVGGKSEIEMKETRDRAEDAVLAVKSAMEEGIVEGGGVALVRAFTALKSTKNNKIYKTLLNVLMTPFSQIFINSSGLINKDFKGNRFDNNIIDPLKVTRCALENSASVAKTILSTEAVVLNEHLWN